VVADRRRNAVIVQAPPAQMASMEKMIVELDAPISDDSLAPQIYPLKYVSAADMEDVLNELFLKKTQQRSYWDFFSDDADTSTPDRDVGRLYGKVRITSEPYSNALIVTSNSKECFAVLENVLRQLDVPSPAGESTLRIGLKYAKADTVANSLPKMVRRRCSQRASHRKMAITKTSSNRRRASKMDRNKPVSTFPRRSKITAISPGSAASRMRREMPAITPPCDRSVIWWDGCVACRINVETPFWFQPMFISSRRY
jgi:hypothetical protein